MRKCFCLYPLLSLVKGALIIINNRIISNNNNSNTINSSNNNSSKIIKLNKKKKIWIWGSIMTVEVGALEGSVWLEWKEICIKKWRI